MAEKKETTHELMEGTLVLYRRERSNIWQCRYKVDGRWQRATTKERDLKKAKEAAKVLLIKAEIRKQENLPVITRKFRSIAKLALERMANETKGGHGKASYADYSIVIQQYLIPFLGNYNIASIDYAVLDKLDAWRKVKMKKAPAQSTMMTHNAALNRVFDEAVLRNYLTEANRLKLDSKGKKSERRAAFELDEVWALLGNFDAWIERAAKETSKELRPLLRDYVTVLLDTGARPGKELMNLKWSQIKIDWQLEYDDEYDTENDGTQADYRKVKRSKRAVIMAVSGKTGAREIVGTERTLEALARIAQRNYGKALVDTLINEKNDDYIFRLEEQKKETSFSALFRSYLDEHNLLIDPKTGQERVFYSLRHTYATFALTHDKVPIHTLAKQMGTSVTMIEKHYSHLNVIKAIDQLRGDETRQLLNSGGKINEIYMSKMLTK